ncbi:MAG TPA: response regulator [Longimicrobiales bacterium]|nr:response regulator [Longimicrobiales bacterium]
MGEKQIRKTILVVEDNKDELMIYTTLLSFRGYSILAAATYDDAITVAQAQQPDLAVIDIQLNDPQDRDGCDLVCALREDERTRDMPVIAHTAFGDVYRDSLDRAGCASIIHKPSRPSVLLEAIASLIGPGANTSGTSEADPAK